MIHNNKPKEIILAEFEEEFLDLVKENDLAFWKELKEDRQTVEYQEMIDRCLSLSPDERLMRLLDFDLDELTNMEYLEINFIKKLRNDSGEAAEIAASMNDFQKILEENPEFLKAPEPTFFEKIGNFFKQLFS